MFIVQQVTDNPNQQQTLILPDGTKVALNLYFSPIQQGWFILSMVYGTFTLKGVRITNSPNILQQFRNQIPFGLACYSTANREPSLQQDFSSGASKLYILSAAEVNQYEEYLLASS